MWKHTQSREAACALAPLRSSRRGIHWLLAALLCTGFCAAVGFAHHGRAVWHPWWVKVRGSRSVDQVLASLAATSEPGLRKRLREAGFTEWPESLTLVGFKEEKRLEVWATTGSETRRLFEYPVLAASGIAGPKLREGDRQVPEGLYRVVGLNPNSAYHLSMKLDYPNAFDRERGEEDGRDRLGGDIFIHGKASSIGCLAIGDAAIEELFVLVARTGVARTRVLIAPWDFLEHPERVMAPEDSPDWTAGLYQSIRRELLELREGKTP